MKFHQNIWNDFQLEWTLVHGRNSYFQYLQCSKGRNSKGRLTRVMVLGFCTSSHGALHLCDFMKMSHSTYRADMSTWWRWICSKGNNSKSKQTRVTVHVFCMSPHSALFLCEVS